MAGMPRLRGYACLPLGRFNERVGPSGAFT